MSDMTPPLPPAAWYRDPLGHGDARYWNGVAWTDSVSRGGVTFTAPVPPDQMRVPPVPGTEYHAPPPAPAPAPEPAPASPPPKSSSSGTSILVAIALVAAAALIAVLVINMLSDDDGDDDDPGSTTVATAPAAPEPTDAPETQTTGPTTDG